MYKQVEGYENYIVNECGRIVNSKYNRELAQTVDSEGYLTVQLWKNGKGKTCLIHRLVALAFIDNPEKKPHVHHKDSDRRNCHVDNLAWVTNKENCQERVKKQTKGNISKKKIMKMYKRKKWNSPEEFLREIMSS